MGVAIRWQDPLRQNPLIEKAGFYDLLGAKGGFLGAKGEALDARAFGVLASHEEAQGMIRKDRLAAANDPEWTAFFVESMVEFLVWSRSPAGKIAPEDVEWLAAEIAQGTLPSMPALLFALVRELNEVPERLTALAMRHARNRHGVMH